MAKVIAAAIGDRERPMPRDVIVVLDGYVLRLRRRDSTSHRRARPRPPRLAQRAPSVRGRAGVRSLPARVPARARSPYRADRARLDADATLDLPAHRSAASVADPTVAAALARGEAAPGEWEHELSARLRRQPEIRAALDRMWPVLSGSELVHDLFGFDALIRSAAGGVLTEAEQRLLFRDARPTSPTSPGPKPTSRWSTRPTPCSGPRAPPARVARRRARRDPELGAGATHGRGARRRWVHQRRPTCSRATGATRRPAPAMPTASRAPSATCSSTRRRTSPRCSGGCWPAAARRGR